jgi:hypothetical protein
VVARKARQLVDRIDELDARRERRRPEVRDIRKYPSAKASLSDAS